MKTLDDLRQSRMRFGGTATGCNSPVPSPEPDGKPVKKVSSSPGDSGQAEETKRLYEDCERMFRAAMGRVGHLAALVDRVNELSTEPWERFELSEAFVARDDELISEIDAEWLSESPDLERFKKLVDDWEANCFQELRRKLAEMRRKPDSGQEATA